MEQQVKEWSELVELTRGGVRRISICVQYILMCRGVGGAGEGV